MQVVALILFKFQTKVVGKTEGQTNVLKDYKQFELLKLIIAKIAIHTFSNLSPRNTISHKLC